MKRITLIQNKGYTIEEVCLIAENKAKVTMDKNILESVEKNFQNVRALFSKNIYGLTTGVGDLSIRKPTKSVDVFQKNILLSHSVGTGENLSKGIVRSAIFSRLIVLSKNMSGVSPELIIFLQDLLNKDVIPLVPALGSIGASDLTILSEIFVILCNKGNVLYQDKSLKPFEAFEKAKINYPRKLQTREGLALINGNNATIGFACILIDQVDFFIQGALETAALSLEARGSTYAVYNSTNQDVKPFPEQKRVANILSELLYGSQQISKRYEKEKRVFLQDPPSFKTIAQIFGNVLGISERAKYTTEVELNSVTDNPVFISDNKTVKPVSSGNYICAQLATIFDELSLCLSSIASTSLSRMKILMNKEYSEGLPMYLIDDNTNNSGFMICIYTAQSLLSEIRALLYPRSAFDLSVANGWEDVSTNAFNVVNNTKKIFNLTKQIIFFERRIALQAIALRKRKNPSIKLSKNAREALRKTSRKLPITTDEEINNYIREEKNI